MTAICHVEFLAFEEDWRGLASASAFSACHYLFIVLLFAYK